MESFVFWYLSQQGLKFNGWAMKTRLTSFSLLWTILTFLHHPATLTYLCSPSVLLSRSNERCSHQDPKWGCSPNERAYACNKDLWEAQKDGQPDLWTEIRYNGVKCNFPICSENCQFSTPRALFLKSQCGKRRHSPLASRLLGCWMVPSDIWAPLGEQKGVQHTQR